MMQIEHPLVYLVRPAENELQADRAAWFLNYSELSMVVAADYGAARLTAQRIKADYTVDSRLSTDFETVLDEYKQLGMDSIVLVTEQARNVDPGGIVGYYKGGSVKPLLAEVRNALGNT